MPELPEVETIRKQLSEKIVGKKIEKIEVRLPKIFQGKTDDVVGAKILSVKRRAKVLIIELSNNRTMLVHFKLSGQMVYGKMTGGQDDSEQSKSKTVGVQEDKEQSGDKIYYPQGIPFAGNYLPGKTTHVIFYFNDGSRLFYNDLRQFGWIRTISNNQFPMTNDQLTISNDKFLEKLGPEPFTDEFSLEYFEGICRKWGRPIKILLMEQDKIAGVGNIYANEALFCAKIAPHKRARDLEENEIKALYDCILKVLEMGLKYGGSSGADEAFITPDGKRGAMQEHFNVYQRDGQLCSNNCGGTIRRMTLGGRGTFFCPACQR